MELRRKLDRSRPYGEVYGLPGALYEQDRVFFNGAGIEVFEKETRPLEDAPDPVEPDMDEIIRPATVDSGPEPSVVAQQTENANSRDLDTMHWTHLKALLEVYGGTWTNRNDAVKYLKNRGA